MEKPIQENTETIEPVDLAKIEDVDTEESELVDVAENEASFDPPVATPAPQKKRVQAYNEQERPEDLTKDRRVFIFLIVSFVVLIVSLIVVVILLFTTDQDSDTPLPPRNVALEHYILLSEPINLHF